MDLKKVKPRRRPALLGLSRSHHRRHVRDRLHNWPQKDLDKLSPEHKAYLARFDRQCIGGEFRESERADWLDNWDDPAKRSEVNRANNNARADILSVSRRTPNGGKAPDGRVIRTESFDEFEQRHRSDSDGDEDGTIRDAAEMMAQGYSSPTDYEDHFLEELDRRRNRSACDDET